MPSGPVRKMAKQLICRFGRMGNLGDLEDLALVFFEYIELVCLVYSDAQVDASGVSKLGHAGFGPLGKHSELFDRGEAA